MKFFFSVLLLTLFVSCSKEEPKKYTKEEMLSFCTDKDSTCTVILPKSMDQGVHCDDYGDGCIHGHMVKAREMDFIAVEYETPNQARRAAKRYHGFVTRNWLLDDVTGEPVLEKFVTEAFPETVKFDAVVLDE